MKTFCYKLYKSEHNAKLHKQINAAGLTFNHCIKLHKRYYKLFGKHLHKFTLMKHLTKLKKLTKFSYLLEYGSQAVHDVAERINRAFELFFGNLQRNRRRSLRKFDDTNLSRSSKRVGNSTKRITRLQLTGRSIATFNRDG